LAVDRQMLNEPDGSPLGSPEQLLEPPLALDQRLVAQIVAVKLDQVEREQHRLMTPPFAPQRVEVRQPVVTGDHRLAVEQERRGLDGSAASTIAGKRSAQSWPRLVKQRMRSPARRTISR
jgi:hypothetical protein